MFGSCFQEQFFVLKKTENTKNLFGKKGVPNFCILYVSKTLVFQIISFCCLCVSKKLFSRTVLKNTNQIGQYLILNLVSHRNEFGDYDFYVSNAL